MDSSHGEEGKVSPPAVCRPEAVPLCHQPRSHRALDGMQRVRRKPIVSGLLTHNRTVGLNVIRQMVELENCGRLGQGFLCCCCYYLSIYLCEAVVQTLSTAAENTRFSSVFSPALERRLAAAWSRRVVFFYAAFRLGPPVVRSADRHRLPTPQFVFPTCLVITRPEEGR